MWRSGQRISLPGTRAGDLLLHRCCSGFWGAGDHNAAQPQPGGTSGMFSGTFSSSLLPSCSLTRQDHSGSCALGCSLIHHSFDLVLPSLFLAMPMVCLWDPAEWEPVTPFWTVNSKNKWLCLHFVSRSRKALKMVSLSWGLKWCLIRLDTKRGLRLSVEGGCPQLLDTASCSSPYREAPCMRLVQTDALQVTCCQPLFLQGRGKWFFFVLK